MKNFKDYLVWQKAMDLVIVVYQITSGFPADEKFGLISQMRRSSVSIPSNIAEGAGKSTEKHFCEFLQHSLGSSFELETQLIISHKLNYLSETLFSDTTVQIVEIQKMLGSLIRKIKE